MSFAVAPRPTPGSPRLHGREVELAQAAEALRDPGVRLAVVRGAAGVGKTALMQAVLHDAGAAGALTGMGKYAQGQSGLEPLLAALEQAVSAGLDQLFDPQAGLDDLFRGLGANRDVFAAMGSHILRPPSSAPASRPFTAAEADERLVQAVLQSLRWLEGFGADVVLLLDDWGRAGAQAQRIYGRIIAEPGLARTRLLATERPEEAYPEPLPPGVALLQLAPLGPAAQRSLACELLQAKASAADEILDLLGPAADTPFDLIQSIQVLSAAGALIDGRTGWRLDRTRAAPALAGAAAGTVVLQATAQTPEAQTLAQLLAVYGDHALTEDLKAAAGVAPAAFQAALAALAAGGVVQRLGDRAAYTHDRLRAEVLAGLSAQQRAHLAANLAETLRVRGAEPGDARRGAAMLRLRREAGLADVDRTWWLQAFTRGAAQSRERGDREEAEAFVQAGLDLAAAGGLDFALASEATLAAVARGDNAAAERFSDEMARLARTPVELGAADEMRVFARRMSGDLDAALEVARQVLGRMGVKLPRKANLPALLGAIAGTLTRDPAKAVRPLTPEELQVEAPLMRATNGIGSLLFERSPLMAMVLVTTSVPPRVAYGTAAGAATYALMSCLFGLYGRAARWADAADRLQTPDQPLPAVASQYASNFGHVFVRPRSETRVRRAQLEALAYAVGDLPAASYGNRDAVLDAIFSDDPLDQTAELADRSIQVAERLNDTATVPHVRALRQFIEQVRTPSAEPARLAGDHFDIAAALGELQAAGLGNTARGVAALEALLAVLYGRYGLGAQLSARAWPRFSAAPFQAQTQIWAFATGLALYRTGSRPAGIVRWNLRRLARLNPADFAHRARLLDAEHARSRGRRRPALAAYAQAVAMAARSNSWLEQGLVGIAAAEGAESLGDGTAAEAYRESARTAWTLLGAHGLVAARFGGLAAPVPARSFTPANQARELDLLAQREAAERTSRAKSRLLATVGHELRTPLQGALGLLELAEETGEPLDVPKLRKAVSHLSEVVGDLTDLGALDGGVLAVARTPFEVKGAVASVLALHHPTARVAGRRILSAEDGPPLWVMGDEGRVRQVLSNLVGNALRHGRGDVTVEIGSAGRDRLSITVSDDGPPLSEGDVRRIFEPFERGGEASPDGLGVGLFLGRHLARLMGGDLTVAETAAGGKGFRLEIAAPRAEAPRAAAGGLAGMKVLIAEDNALSRQVLAALLRHEGCDVTEAEDGGQATEQLETGTFDLVLLDQRMPRRTGAEVAERLRASGRGEPRIALMSASSDLEPHVLGSGYVDVLLQKPVSLRALRELAEPAAPRRAAGGSARLSELRRQLGAEAVGLFREVRPSLQAELDSLGRATSAGDLVRCGEQLHRVRGLARHFGLDRIAVAAAEPADLAAARASLRRMRRLVRTTDWSEFA